MSISSQRTTTTGPGPRTAGERLRAAVGAVRRALSHRRGMARGAGDGSWRAADRAAGAARGLPAVVAGLHAAAPGCATALPGGAARRQAWAGDAAGGTGRAGAALPLLSRRRPALRLRALLRADAGPLARRAAGRRGALPLRDGGLPGRHARAGRRRRAAGRPRPGLRPAALGERPRPSGAGNVARRRVPAD